MDANVFRHQPLEFPTSQLRLLRCTSALDDGLVSFDLKTFDIDKAPHYAAISYMWGQLAATEWIQVNRKDFPVAPNCLLALEQAMNCIESIRNDYPRSVGGLYYYWIDSVCIDQSLMAEKGHQVAIMGDIFANARVVLACLGASSGNSGYLMRMMRPPRHLVLDNHEPYHPLGYLGSIGVGSLRSLYYGRADATACEDIREFGNRAYFSRLWIVQELLVASRALVLCGVDYIPLGMLALFRSELPIRYSTKDHIMRTQMDRILDHVDFRCLRSVVNDIGMECPSLLAASLHWNCTDPRDKVYGLLRLVQQPKHTAPLLPDYSQSTLQVAIDVLCHFEDTRNIPVVFQLLSTLGLNLENSDVADLVYDRRTPTMKTTSGDFPYFLAPHAHLTTRLRRGGMGYL